VAHRIIRSTVTAVLLLSATMMAGCTTEEIEAGQSYSPYGGSDKYPIQVAKGPVTLNVASRKGGLQPVQVNAVSNFARKAATSGLTPVTISRPSGGGVSAANAQQIAQLIKSQGVPAQLIKMRTYHGSAHSPVKVSFTKTYAKTYECGLWPQDMTATDMNDFHPNHGCAVQANIAAMVSDPMDFEVPDATTPSSSVGAVNAINAANTPTPGGSAQPAGAAGGAGASGP
jgi:pilus assembly protein CpaD